VVSFCDSWLVLLSVGYFCWAYAYLGILAHFPNWGIENGLSSDRAALTVTAFGIASTVGRVIVGKLADLFGRIGVLWVGFLVMALDIASLTIARRLWQLVLFARVRRLFWCGILPLACRRGPAIRHSAATKCAGIAGLALATRFRVSAIVAAAGCAAIGSMWIRATCAAGKGGSESGGNGDVAADRMGDERV